LQIQLLTDPVSISCGHRFCRQCISSYWDQSSSSGGFGCPQCRKRSRTHPLLHPHKDMEELRTVLTKGIAGIGKTVSVQKFILDWAEGKSNQDVDFMFVLPFRELNLIKDEQYSLHTLLCNFHPEIKDLALRTYDTHKCVFVFDGLNESTIPLNFLWCENVFDITTISSVNVLITNLFNGELLSSALIWITSRPEGTSQIPPQYINRLTEIQGFTDAQKEEYFRKRIGDQDQAKKIISHIKTVKSLHIMCHIPVFCWISSTVLQKIIKKNNDTEIPKTLTEMYINFMWTQLHTKNAKYKEKNERDLKTLLESSRTLILKLAELAFKQLMKGNVLFYEEDLRECGIDVTEASVYSGICTEIFREESVLYQTKVYCFVHLSFQEFLATFYSQNGHLDLFLRFLLGITLETNQRLLQESILTEKSNNLFLCLTEIHDQSLSREIQQYLQSDKESQSKLSPGLCSAIAFLMQMSEEVLDEVDLKKFNTSEEGYRRLIPAVYNCRKALLPICNLGEKTCENLGSALQLTNSILRALDLTNNDLHDSGVTLLSAGLKSSHCKLEILRLSGCLVTGEGCSSLASALSLNPSHLKELVLTYNHPGDSGMKLLSARLEDPLCKLDTLKYVKLYINKQAKQKGRGKKPKGSKATRKETRLQRGIIDQERNLGEYTEIMYSGQEIRINLMNINRQGNIDKEGNKLEYQEKACRNQTKDNTNRRITIVNRESNLT
uniref:NACHT domain-containing protein n=1 Tax=Electrophorus electricus TaxID=8005 RepID=A0AAY5ERY8_ELEEL